MTTSNMAMERKDSQIQEAELADKEDRAAMSLKTSLRDPEYRGKILRWIAVPIAMLNIGIIDSQGGATLLDLQILTSTDEQMADLFFTAYNLGYTLGTLLGGFLYGKLNNNLLLPLCSVLAGGSTIATPYCDTFLLMFISRCIVGFFLGIVLCVANAEHMCIWATKGESLLQFINFTYALGGIVGPAMASPFITEKDDDKKTSSHQNGTSGIFINYTMTFNNSINYTVTCDNFTYTNIATDTFINKNNLTLENFINLTLECQNDTEGNNADLPRSTNVHYAFLIAGLISVLTAIPFLITHLAFKKQSADAEERSDSNTPDRKLPLLLTVFLSGLLLLYYFFYCSIEVTFSSYLLVFIVKHFKNIGTHEAAYIMTYYWALFATGRFISIFTSKYICPRNLVCIHLSMIAAAIAGLIAGALYQRFDVLTVFACLMGLSFSATYAAAMSWTEAELMKVNGPISAVIFVGESIGATVTPFVVGDLMESVSNMWFCYSIVVVLALAASMLTIMMTFNKCYVNRNYGKLSAAIVQEKPSDIPDIVIPKTYF